MRRVPLTAAQMNYLDELQSNVFSVVRSLVAETPPESNFAIVLTDNEETQTMILSYPDSRLTVTPLMVTFEHKKLILTDDDAIIGRFVEGGITPSPELARQLITQILLKEGEMLREAILGNITQETKDALANAYSRPLVYCSLDEDLAKAIGADWVERFAGIIEREKAKLGPPPQSAPQNHGHRQP